MKSLKTLQALALALGLLPVCAFSYSSDNCKYSEATHQGKITVINNSDFPINLAVHGERCQVTHAEAQSSSSSSGGGNQHFLPHTVNIKHPCQEIFMHNRETRTFYIDEANVRGSNRLWLEMAFPTAFDSTRRWVCFNRNTRHYVNLNDESFSRHHSVVVEIRRSYKTLAGSYSCEIHYTN